MKYLIEKGFDGNIKNDTGSTALHYGKITHFDYFYPLFLFFKAAHNRHFDIVKYFIEKGIDGNIKNETGETALYYGKITQF